MRAWAASDWLASLQQHETVYAFEFLLHLFRAHAREESPEPHHPHLAIETLGCLHRGMVFGLPPTKWLEEFGAFRGSKLERRVARVHALSPHLLHHREQSRVGEVDDPPLEAGRRV